ncbi:MAG: Crp/Fnr family transcriptional regulator [Bacteroidia bacterium]
MAILACKGGSFILDVFVRHCQNRGLPAKRAKQIAKGNMKTLKKFIDYLNTITDLPAGLVNELEVHASIVQVEKGRLYFEKNTHSLKLGFLAEGIMRIYDVDSIGREWNMVILAPPMLLLGNPDLEAKSNHYIATITACEILEFPISFLRNALKEYPAFREIQTKLLLELFKTKSEREYDFLSMTAKDRYLKFCEKNKDIIDQLPQFHIASYLGITSTQLSRINGSIRNQQM